MNGIIWSREEMDILCLYYPELGPKGVLPMLPRRTITSIRRQANKFRIVKRKAFTKGYEGLRAPIGYERIDSLGYVMVKLADNKWKLKHREVWKAHYGKYPTQPIEFIDGTRTNCDISNLRLTTKAAQLRRNSVRNLPEDLRRVIYLKGTLTKLIRRTEHESHGHS